MNEKNYNKKRLIILTIRSCLLVNFAIFLPGNPIFGQHINGKPDSCINVYQWIEQYFAKGKVPPFSFVYGGKSSDSFIRNWRYSVEKIKQIDPNVNESVYIYSNRQSELVAQCFDSCFNDFQAVEWVLKFSNTLGKNTPLIEKAAVMGRFKQLDIVPDVFWMDTGWSEGGNAWWEGVGNWTVDKKRFPYGLKHIADAAHEAGSKFLVWFEPDGVRKGTRFYNEHLYKNIKIRLNRIMDFSYLLNNES